MHCAPDHKACADGSAAAFSSAGMNKMVINHLEKLFVTSDASTITQELEVQHPAAKLLVMAAQAQQQEIGDGTNMVLSFAGELLANAESLLRDGLHPTEIAEGYAKAGAKALDILDTLVVPGTGDEVAGERAWRCAAQAASRYIAAVWQCHSGALAAPCLCCRHAGSAGQGRGRQAHQGLRQQQAVRI
jgi:hypothetical protein